MKAFVRGHINITHHKDRGSVTIELTESAVLVGYLSSFVFLVSGLLAGCTIFRRQQQQRNVEACTCAKCKGQFRLRKELGAGGYGHAQLVTRQGKPFVLKMVGCDSINEANAALTEASCLQQLNHPNVVRFEDVFLHRHDSGGISVSILMEFCAGGDLIDRLECRADEKPLTELQVIRFLESLCYALHHVHNCGVLHRDLKSSNIFVTRYDREVKLGDFGLAACGLSPRRLSGSPRRMSRCGTAMYMSPEVAERKPYGAASDTYGLGCVLLEMMLRCQLRERRPFEERKDYIQETLNHARGHGWSTFDEMASLAWKMLDESPKSRIGLPQAAAVSAAAVSVLVRQQEAESVANGGVLNNSNAADDGRTRVRQPKLIAAAERTRRPAGPAQRRKLQYAD